MAPQRRVQHNYKRKTTNIENGDLVSTSQPLPTHKTAADDQTKKRKVKKTRSWFYRFKFNPLHSPSLMFTIFFISVYIWMCPLYIHQHAMDCKFDTTGEITKLYRIMLQYEEGGNTMAIIHKGELICHGYGGIKEWSTKEHVDNRTMMVGYSTSKVWAGFAAAALVSKGQLQYDRLVRKFWPFYSQGHKRNTTIRHVLDHEAGLPTFGIDFNINKANDRIEMRNLIERATAHWAPGTKLAYHALTYGFLVDQVLSRVDTEKRPLNQLIEEMFIKNESDYYIGVPEAECERVAKVMNPSIMHSIFSHTNHLFEFIHLVAVAIKHSRIGEIAASYPSFMSVMSPQSFNNWTIDTNYNDCNVLQLPSISALGIGSAIGFANVISRALQSEDISQEVWNLLATPTKQAEDIVIGKKRWYGHGFNYVRHPMRPESWNVQFVGNGMQFLEFNKEDDLVFVYFRNGLKPASYSLDQLNMMVSLTYKTLFPDRTLQPERL